MVNARVAVLVFVFGMGFCLFWCLVSSASNAPAYFDAASGASSDGLEVLRRCCDEPRDCSTSCIRRFQDEDLRSCVELGILPGIILATVGVLVSWMVLMCAFRSGRVRTGCCMETNCTEGSNAFGIVMVFSVLLTLLAAPLASSYVPASLLFSGVIRAAEHEPGAVWRGELSELLGRAPAALFYEFPFATLVQDNVGFTSTRHASTTTAFCVAPVVASNVYSHVSAFAACIAQYPDDSSRRTTEVICDLMCTDRSWYSGSSDDRNATFGGVAAEASVGVPEGRMSTNDVSPLGLAVENWKSKNPAISVAEDPALLVWGHDLDWYRAQRADVHNVLDPSLGVLIGTLMCIVIFTMVAQVFNGSCDWDLFSCWE